MYDIELGYVDGDIFQFDTGGIKLLVKTVKGTKNVLLIVPPTFLASVFATHCHFDSLFMETIINRHNKVAKKAGKKDAKKSFKRFMAKAKRREWALHKYGLPSDESKQKMLEGNAKKLRSNMTAPEKKVETLLQEMELEHDAQKVLGSFIYDFCLPQYRILIEVDGDYYHGHPDKYEKDDLNHLQKKIKRNDLKKDMMASGSNYKLLRFWECDINDNIKQVKKIIMEHIKSSTL